MIKILAIILAASLIVGGALKPLPSAPSPALIPEKAPDDKRIDAAIFGAAAIKRSLRNPASFQLMSANVTQAGAVCYQFRAQNGFGGLNVLRAVRVRSITLTSEMDGFARLWNRECAGKAIALEAAYQVQQFDQSFGLTR